MKYLALKPVYHEWHLLWMSNHKYLTAFLLALTLDTISTINFMVTIGPEHELHPLVRFAAAAWGPVMGPIVAALYKTIGALIVVLYWKKITQPLFTIATITYLLAGAYNYFAVELYTLGYIHWLPV